MSTHVKYLNTRYRDQLIRELQVLGASKGLQYPADVADLMSAAAKEGARVREASFHWWRRYLPTVYVRRDDVIFPSDLYLLEATLIEHLDAAGLKVRVAGFRDMLSNLLTEESYIALSACFKDLNAQVSTDDLLPEARSLISRMYRRYAGVPAVEDIRSNAAAWMLLCTLVIILAVAFAVPVLHAPTSLIVGVCGAVGATISTIERLYRFDPRHEPFRTWLAIKSGAFTLMLSPLVGFVFASIIYLLIKAGLVGGQLFPDLNCLDLIGSKKGCGYPSFLNADTAKLYAWGFVAGWAERMVPDVLNKLVPQAPASVKVK